MISSRTFLTLLLASLLVAPLALAQTRPDGADARVCDADRDGTITESERTACMERCDENDDGRLNEPERQRCIAAAREGHAMREPPSGDCRAAMTRAMEMRDGMRANITARWNAFKAAQEKRTLEFGRTNHTEEEWTAFRAELALARERAEAAVRNQTEMMEARVGRLQACAGVAAAGRYAACDSAPGDFSRFSRMVDRQAMEFGEGARARAGAKLANATTPEERAQIEARIQEEIAQHRAQMESKWHALRDAHARSCLREGAGPRNVSEIQESVRADRLACNLQAEGVLDPFLDANGRVPENWTQTQRAEFAALRRQAAQARAACEGELHDEWRDEVRARFNQTRRADRFGAFNVSREGDSAGTATGKYVGFHWEMGSLTISDHTVQGVPLFERFWSPHAIGAPSFRGARVAVDGSENGTFHAVIHDNPTGGFEGRCAAPGCSLTLPEGALVSGTAKDNGTTRYSLALGEARAHLFVNGEHAWTNETLAITGSWRILMPSENFVLEGVANRHREKIDDAVERGNVLAEVNVVADAAGVAAETIELAPVEDAGDAPDVAVEASTEDGEVVVDVSADATTGESIVINVDEDALGGDNLTADDIEVTYYEIAEDGTQTEVEVAAADDVEDALGSDEETPEVFVEAGEDGVQLVVSNPHFSDKRIVVSSASEPTTPPEDATPPSPATTEDKGAPGAGVVMIALGAAGAALALRRRSA